MYYIVYILGVGFLQQRRPELIAVVGARVQQLVSFGRQKVVDDDIYPFT